MVLPHSLKKCNLSCAFQYMPLPAAWPQHRYKAEVSVSADTEGQGVT